MQRSPSTNPNPPYSTSPLLDDLDGFEHGFFGARGGVSKGQYSSLNCGHSSVDNTALVQQNRLRVARCFNLPEQQLYSLCQAHTTKVVTLETNSPPQFDIRADGMVSNQSGVGLGALGADCASVLFVDPVNRVVGAAHSGWRGALLGINEAVINQMCDLGAVLCNIHAAIGPAMQQQCYEVQDDFVSMFSNDSPIKATPFFKPQHAKIYFDTPGYIHERLRTAGIQHIDQSMEDTFTQPEQFFSYRRAQRNSEKGYGRQIAVILIKS